MAMQEIDREFGRVKYMSQPDLKNKPQKKRKREKREFCKGAAPTNCQTHTCS